MAIERKPDGRILLTGTTCLPKWYPDGEGPTEPTPATGKQANRGGKNEPKRKTADRFAVLNAFVDATMHNLTRREIAVWLVLYRDTRNGTARTSQENIAKRAGMSVQSVKVATRSLVDAGLLQVVFQGGLNRGPSRFRVVPLGSRGSITE